MTLMRTPKLLLALSLLTGCRSAPDASPGTVISTSPPAPRTVSVTGTSEIETSPDEFVVSVGVDVFAADAPKAKAENDRLVHALLAVVKRYEIDAKNVRTDGFSLSPRFEGAWEVRRLIGFDARKTVVVTLHDDKQVEPLLEALFRDGANRLDGVTFGTTKLLELRKEARTRAVAAARDKAAAMAGVLGQKLGRPLKMDEVTGSQGWSTNFMANDASANDTRSAVREAMAAGKLRIPSTVAVTFELGDG